MKGKIQIQILSRTQPNGLKKDETEAVGMHAVFKSKAAFLF